MPDVEIAIIGAGPAGISAAAHAAELGLRHVLIEAGPKHADTIQKYQKGKHVMATPDCLPLRSPVAFTAGSREAVLAGWHGALTDNGVAIQYNSRCIGISGEKGAFVLALSSGVTLTANAVVLAIGIQGNPRRLGCIGEDANRVQYRLDDPAAVSGETVVVIGASDSGIEDALALAPSNSVHIVNRGNEFARAKESNLSRILAEIENGNVQCFYDTNVERIESADGTNDAGTVVLNEAGAEVRVDCDRVIARIGATPQRQILESFGIEFGSDDPNEVPMLTREYETNVPGIHIIGALGGYPLIKQALNQGFEVVEYIVGNDIVPADHDLLAKQFEVLPYQLEVDTVLSMMQERIPLFADVNALQFRELVLGSKVRVPKPGSVIYQKGAYIDTFFTVLDGEVEIEAEDGDFVASGQGTFFGEVSLFSGRRTTATVRAGKFCAVVETPRRTMIKLIHSVDRVRRTLDATCVLRVIQRHFAPQATFEELRPIGEAATIRQYAPGEALFNEGDDADSLHVIRSGSVTVSRKHNGKDVTVSYVAAGNHVGEMGLLGNGQRTATIRATVKTETICLGRSTFLALLERQPELRAHLQQEIAVHSVRDANSSCQTGSNVLNFLMDEGFGEAVNVLLIHQDLCTGCNNCELACAETHDGTSRLNRSAGPSYASVHVPTSCRHCEQTHCMSDCPPDAIKRSSAGEVYIEDTCIGCGKCEENCPYDVIRMSSPPPEKPGIWSWLLFGSGPGPGEDEGALSDADGCRNKKAVKCDMCKDVTGGPACVRACPTGAAVRTNPEQLLSLIEHIA